MIETSKEVIEKLRNRIYKLEDFYEKTNKMLPDLLEMYDFFEEQYKTTQKLSKPIQKQISDKEIIETLGLKEIPKKTPKNLKLK